MALTRKWLSTLGIEADKVDEIIEAHVEVTNGLKSDRDKYKEAFDKLPDVEKELEELKAQGEENPFEKKYNDIKKEYDDYKAEVEAEKLNNKKFNLAKSLLEEINISSKVIDRFAKSVAKEVEIDDKNEFSNKTALKEKLDKEFEDYKVTTKKVGAKTEHPPQNTGGTMSAEEIRKIKDPIERQKAMYENASEFGIE